MLAIPLPLRAAFSENKGLKCPLEFLVVLLLVSIPVLQAQSATVTGLVLDEELNPLENVNIQTEEGGTTTDSNGFYVLQVIADKECTITFSHLGREKIILEGLILTTNETFGFSPVLKPGTIRVKGVVVTASGGRQAEGITTISPEIVQKIPGANAGVENVLKLLPGVTSNNELSTQYGVRGGNYDENLVYINGIEVYRPFLVRSGQQEGFSIVNSSMVQQLKFSAGGFQARHGDKLSSVLDISYKQPAGFGLDMEASLLGGSATMETLSGDKKLSSLSGLRYRDNSLFVNSQQTQTNSNPLFADFQSSLGYKLSDKFHLNFLGILSLNRYRNQPLTRQTNFGTLNDPRALFVYYEGQEDHRYATSMGALKAQYLPSDRVSLQFISSVYHTTEEEYSDVIAQYELGSVDADPASGNTGEISAPRGIGAEYVRRRNILDALVTQLSHHGRFQRNKKSIEWGLDYRYEDFRDQIREAEFIDSAGFFIRPADPPLVNNEPEEPFEAPLEPYQGVFARNFTTNHRVSGYLQFGWQTAWKRADVYYNAGIRAQHWTIRGEGVGGKGHVIVSPRMQLALKPHWEKDMLFRLAAGIYQQPPFYREMRDQTGMIHPELDAQRSYHILMGNEFSFEMWGRPFNLSSEAYYKYLDKVNPFTLEDVRIRYAADNIAVAYAWGMDWRLYGAFVPGLESWVSLGYLSTRENIQNRGYIPRPTDQRVKVGILFQDYIPSMPQVRMYLNLVYQTGVPGGSPSYADPYIFQNRLRDYRRADLGISHIFADNSKKFPEGHWLHPFEEFYAGVEIFNLFNNQNSITNTWVRDADSKQEFAVPNFMTSRVLNIKVRMRF